MKTEFVKPDPEWNPQMSELPIATRNTHPVAKEDLHVETQFKQETFNPSVRGRTYPEDEKLTEEFLTDLMMQLNVAQKAAQHFEAEGAVLRGVLDRMSENYDKLVEDHKELKAAYDGLKKPSLWERISKWFASFSSGKGQFGPLGD